MTDIQALVVQLLARSRYAIPREEAHAQIRRRRAALLAHLPGPMPTPVPSEADFAVAELMPVLDQPEAFAAAFWRNRTLPRSSDDPPKPPDKKPRGRRRGKFEVIDGGADAVDKER